MNFNDVNEKSRTYIYPTTERNLVTFKDVKKVCVRPSGNHRLELGDGSKVIVMKGWLAVVFDGEWSF